MAVVNKNFVIKNGLEVDGSTLVVDATNNRVGINSSSPGASLDIIGVATIGVGGSNKVSIGGDGGRNIEIGVGNTSASAYIDFHTADNVDSDFSARIEKGPGLNGGFAFVNKGTGSYSFFSGVTEQLTLTSTGNLGIGAPIPSRKLHVVGTSLFTSNVGIGTAINIVPYDNLDNGTIAFEGSAGQLFAVRNNLTSGSIFSVNDVSGIPSIDVDANGTVELAPFGGNVGVGITNPFSKLQVNTNSSSLTYPLDLWNAGTGPLVVRLITQNSAGTSTSPFDILKHPNGEHSLRAVDSAGYFTFLTGGYNERVRISATGNVGIGTNNPNNLLQLGPSVSTNLSYLKITGAGGTHRYYRYIGIPGKATAAGVADTPKALYVGKFYNGTHTIQLYAAGNSLEEGLSLTLFREWGVGQVPVITSEQGSDLIEITFHYQNIDNDSYHVFINFTWNPAVPLGEGGHIKLDITSLSNIGTFELPTTPTIPTLDTSNQILQRFIIASGGNVGIGTTNPTAQLFLRGSTDPVLDITQTTTSAARWILKARTNGVTNDTGIYQDASNNLQFAARDGSGNLRIVLDTNTLSGSYINSTAGFAVGTSSTNTGYTTLATNLRLGVTTKAGTYSQSGTTITVTCANHGLNSNDSVFLDFTSGTAVDNYFSQVVVINSSTFTVTAPSLTTSGNVTIYPETQLRFPGAYGDGSNSFDHTVISERLYGGADKSELLIFKGNDAGTSIQDNIRLAAAGDIYFHTGSNGLYGNYITNHGSTINSSTVSILANGNVGVGVTNPNRKLTVNGIIRSTVSGTTADAAQGFELINSTLTSDARVLMLSGLNDGSAIIRNSATTSNGIRFVLGTSEVLSLINGGNIGIGTTNPGSILAVNGYITENPGDGTYWNVVTQKDIGFNSNQVPLNQYLGQLAFADTYSPSGLRRDGGGTDDVFVNSSGNIGIGTTSPVDHVELYKLGGLNPRVLFHHQGQASYKVGVHGLVFKIAGMDNGVGGHTADFANSNSQVISMTNVGNVGVGLTNPSCRLHVYGDASDTHGLLKVENTKNSGGMYWPAASFINGWSNHSYGTVAEFRTVIQGGNDRPSLLFYNSFGNHSWSVGQTTADWGVADGFGIGYRASNNPDGFSSWPTSYLSITTTGNVGIGVTNPSDKLQVNGTINGYSDISLGGELNFYTPNNKYIDFYTRNSAGTNFAAHLRLVNHDSTVFQTGIRMFYGGAVELYHNNAKRLETTSNGIYVEGSALGSTVGNTVTLASFFHNNGNGSYLNIVSTRVNASQSWTGSSTKIVNVTDVTSQGYIEFNPNGSTYGLAFGQGATEFARFVESGNLGIGTTNPVRKFHVQGTSTFSSNVRVGTVIEQVPYDSLNGGTLSWEGSAGQLFSITNNLTSGSIFSVNDVSGIPSIDVDANGTIELAPFGGSVGIGTTLPRARLHVPYRGVLASETIRIGDSATFGEEIYSIYWGPYDTTNTGIGPYPVARGFSGRQGLGIHINTGYEFTVKSSGWDNLFGVQGGTGNAYLKGNVGIGTTSATDPLHVEGNIIRIRYSRTPASATATGTQGQICWDANYIYVCIATNTWRRTAISAW